MPNLLNIKETAGILDITPATVLNWEKQGIISSKKVGSKLAFVPAEIQKLAKDLESGKMERLQSRANKKNSDKTFLPEEYFAETKDIPLFTAIVQYISQHDLDTEKSLFVLVLKRLIDEHLLAKDGLKNLLKFHNRTEINENLKSELAKWQLNINFEKANKHYEKLLSFKLPASGDFLGAIYQAVKKEGHKSKEGSYYTPAFIAHDMIKAHIKQIKGHAKILDPCCGTGQFLLEAGKLIKKKSRLIHPGNIWGYDIDPVAVQLARINLMLLFRDYDFNPNIYQRNVIYNYAYDDKNQRFKNFDLIVGNPPWGAEFKIEQTTFLKEQYPEILSYESYSYFLFIALNMLKTGGALSFILPESILNIKIHKDIRSYILLNTKIEKIQDYGRLFKNVFTPVVRLDLEKSNSDNSEAQVILSNHSYSVRPGRFLKNSERIFDIYLTDKDEKLIQKVYGRKHTTLRNQADWALGIVTGNNAHFLSNSPKKGYKEVYKGIDIERFSIKSAKNYLLFEPKRFQQMAPLAKFRAAEKLIYRFISKRLVFAWDDKKRLTLNSANLLIPKIPDYPAKVIMALFNSSLYQYVFEKKFFTHKVLRSHLEQFPLPILDNSQKNTLLKQVDRLMLAAADKDFFAERYKELDQAVFDIFDLNEEERKYILDFIS